MTRRAIALLLAIACAPAIASAADAGKVRWTHHTVRSPATGKIERFWVGAPANPAAGRRYPVVVFLPGLLDTENHWKGALAPCLGSHEFVAVCPSVGGASWFMNSPRQPWMRWGDYLAEELLPFVEANYPASARTEDRAVAGISAGAHGALYQAVTRPRLFGHVLVASGAMELRGYAGQVGLEYWVGPRSTEALPLYAERSCLVLASRLAAPAPFGLYLDAGDSDGAKPQMEALRQVLDGRGIPYDWHVGHGGHNWAYWKSRVPDWLAWLEERLPAGGRPNREAGSPAKSSPLVEAQPPVVAPSKGTLEALAAPWREGLLDLPLQVTGLPAEGAPFSQADGGPAAPGLSASMGLSGHRPLDEVFRLELVLSTPDRRAGTVTLNLSLQNGRGAGLTGTRLPLKIPAGEPNRKVTARLCIAVELKDPDPLRGGIVLAAQRYGEDGRPAGNPAVGAARPGTASLEFWPIAPTARLALRLSLEEGDLPLASVHAARLFVRARVGS